MLCQWNNWWLCMLGRTVQTAYFNIAKLLTFIIKYLDYLVHSAAYLGDYPPNATSHNSLSKYHLNNSFKFEMYLNLKCMTRVRQRNYTPSFSLVCSIAVFGSEGNMAVIHLCLLLLHIKQNVLDSVLNLILCILWGHIPWCGSFSRNTQIYLSVTGFWMLIFENDVNVLTLWVTWAESGVLAVGPHITADRRWSLRFPEVSGLDLSPWGPQSLHVQTPWTSTCYDRVEKGQIL